MDLYRLNGQYQVTDLVEGWNSLVWSERYIEAGDFELDLTDVEYGRQLLPENTLVAIRQSGEVMRVETNEVPKPAGDDAPMLKVKGRTIETVLEDREVLEEFPDLGVEGKLILSGVNAIDAARDFIQRRIITAKLAADRIPLATVTTSYHSGTLLAGDWTLDMGEAYSALLNILKGAGVGIRNNRPSSTTSNLIIELYEGADRTGQITIDVKAGHLDEPSYLWSVKGYKNVVFLVSPVGSIWYGDTQANGFDRRVLSVNASDIQEVTPPATVQKTLEDRARKELEATKKTTVTDGTLSEDFPYRYGRDFDLGDKLYLAGRYGMHQVVRVNEFIRAEDEQGYREYPGLEPVEELYLEIRELLGWTSPITIIWLWHALFDGTCLCRCAHSKEYKERDIHGHLHHS
jgi:hypothetical protein